MEKSRSRRWIAIAVAIVASAVLASLSRRTGWLKNTFDIQLQVELQWGHVLLVVLVNIAVVGYAGAHVWVQKALKPRRTPGNAEISTATADIFNKIDAAEVRDPDEHFERMERTSDKVPHERKDAAADTSAAAEPLSTEDRVYRAFSKISSRLPREAFTEFYSRCIVWHHLDDGDTLFSRGDELGDIGMYIVVEGSLSAYRSSTSLTAPFQRYHAGDFAGDISMLARCKRFFTLRADTDVELVRVSTNMFKELAAKYPAWVLSFMRTSLSRNWYTAHFFLRGFLQISSDDDQLNHHQCALTNYFAEGTPNGDALASFEPDLQEMHLSSGQVIYEHSTTRHRHMYILKKGRVCLTPKPPMEQLQIGAASSAVESALYQSVEVGPGAVFGGVSFIASCGHTDSARCMTACVVAIVTSDDFSKRSDSVLVQLLMTICEELICPVLRQFEGLMFERHWIPAGKLLFKSGDTADEAYIVVSGRLRIFSRRADGTTKTLLEAARGESVGELSLLAGDEHHSYSCISVRDCETVRIPKQAFLELQARHPTCLRRFSTIIARRLRELSSKSSASHRSPMAKISTIAVVPTSSSVDVTSFVENLADALQFYGSSLHVSRELLFTKVSEDGHVEGPSDLDLDERMRRSMITHVLNDLEEAHDVLIFSLTHQLSASWFVSERESQLIWPEVDAPVSNKDLVLLHDDHVALPNGTRHWFQGRHLNAHHHIRRSSHSDYGRLARRICRRAVGLVLGGGGARGLAHMGTMQALHELHVPIDMIGGTSQGAFMAGLFAMHGQLAMEESVKMFAARMGSVVELLKDATFPIMSYFSGQNFSEAIRFFFKDVRIEDLWIPYFCVTTNLTESDIEVHTTGLLWAAVRSSMTVVEYLPPMWMNGSVLIDGGYVDNLPVDIMRDRFGPDILIGVDVENKAAAFRGVHDFGSSLSGWWLLWLKVRRLVLPWGPHPKVPKFSDIVSALSYINNSRNVRSFLNEKLMDVYIRPELGSVLLLDYHKYDEIRTLGFKQARHIMGRWVMENRRLVSDVRGRTVSSVERQYSETNLQNIIPVASARSQGEFSKPQIVRSASFTSVDRQ
ncbi:unnamed protein product (mitochondrion) [Plasmodiophora brassicae]|uniref:Uncharacterized protein n=1 Tax=Plasmodiophora brassicae TaxID=37360 RepID=A0A3P3YED2_PLABS|nr:unnamed protein product [Plasmodiophora brassicae]